MIEVQAGTPLAEAVAAAQRALEDEDWETASLWYVEATKNTGSGAAASQLQRVLRCEHVEALLARERFSQALETAKGYLKVAEASGDLLGQVELELLRGEAYAALGDTRSCARAIVRAEALTPEEALPEHLRPPLLRLKALVAWDEDGPEAAEELLTAAEKGFASLGDPAGLNAVAADRQRLALVAGSSAAVDEVLASPPIEAVHQVLLLARALRRDARYEEATELLASRLTVDLDPALRFPLLHELILLYRLLGDEQRVERLLPLLREAAESAPDSLEALAAVDRVARIQSEGFVDAGGRGLDATVHRIRARIQSGDLEEAERELLSLRPHCRPLRSAALWSLVAGELEVARGFRAHPHAGNPSDSAGQAIGHLLRAQRLAWEASLPEVYTETIRLLGHIHASLRRDLLTASRYWQRATQTDELIARRQRSDPMRLLYLETHATEHDELIEVAAGLVGKNGPGSVPGLVAALEAARGAAILASVLPGEEGRLRNLPSIHDPPACWRWVRDLTDRLPRDQAVWMLHATPKRLHHVLLGDGFLHWANAAIDRHQLFELIEELEGCWRSPELLESLVQEEPDLIPRLLARLAEALSVVNTLAQLPRRFQRLAVVAGDALGLVPFVALPAVAEDRGVAPLVTRWALTDLPCLSALRPLAQRARGNRGDKGLAIRPPASDLTVRWNDRFELLADSLATTENLARRLSNDHFPIVRFDCHGSHDANDATSSWLQVASGPNGEEGRLTAQEFSHLALESCGTLVLGACESGMFERRGSDERIGLVRAGLAAGAAAVVAARWVAADRPASVILDCFHQRLGDLPRDRALQMAQLAVLKGGGQLIDSVPHPEHPARWACWSLYGDAGYQTRASWVRRLIRRGSRRWSCKP